MEAAQGDVVTVPGHQKVTAQEECRGNKGRISLSTPRLKEAGMKGGMHTSVEVFTCTNAAQSAAGRRGVDAAPALRAASQPGLFHGRLFALRQFLKEALNVSRAGPAAPKPDVNLRGAAPSAAIFNSGKTAPSLTTG